MTINVQRLKDCNGAVLGCDTPVVTCAQFNTSQAAQDAAVAAAISAAIAALPAEKYLQGLQSYNATTNVMTLLMNDGTTVPVDMTGLISDAVATALAAQPPVNVGVNILEAKVDQTTYDIPAHTTRRIAIQFTAPFSWTGDNLIKYVDMVDVIDFMSFGSPPTMGVFSISREVLGTNATVPTYTGLEYYKSSDAYHAIQSNDYATIDLGTAVENGFGVDVNNGIVIVIRNNTDKTRTFQLWGSIELMVLDTNGSYSNTTVTPTINFQDTAIPAGQWSTLAFMDANTPIFSNTTIGTPTVPTGTPSTVGGSSYVTNSAGEVFMYTGSSWVLVANGAFTEQGVVHNPYINVPDLVTASATVIQSWTAPRDGIVSFFGTIEGIISATDTVSPTRIAIDTILTKNGIQHSATGQAMSYYSANDGIRGSHSAPIAVAAGDVLELRCGMNTIEGGNTCEVRNSNLTTMYLK